MSAKEIEMLEAFQGGIVLDMPIPDDPMYQEIMVISAYTSLVSMIEDYPEDMPPEGLVYLNSISRAMEYHANNVGKFRDHAILDSLIYPEAV